MRDKLWEKVTQRAGAGYVCQVWSAPTSQGYQYRQHGAGKFELVDFEGLGLVRTQVRKRQPTDVPF